MEQKQIMQDVILNQRFPMVSAKDIIESDIPIRKLSWEQLFWLESDISKQMREYLAHYPNLCDEEKEELDYLSYLDGEIHNFKKRVCTKFIKKSRKPHTCKTCNKVIEKGSSYWSRTYRIIGKRGVDSTEKYCVDCGVPSVEHKLELVC